ncbi:MAG: primosomal protein N' [Candidatus Zixiibacteriota bacterium]|nr:MAG: primosomal protein N' [candidate division Zixibacteria bacterium]
MPSTERYVTVAVSGPARTTFTYQLPRTLPWPEPGQRVLVPFGRQKRVGFFVGETTDRPPGTIKHISKVLDSGTLFPPDLFRLCLWMSDYYFANPADCLSAALPGLMKSARGATLHWGRVRFALSDDLFKRPPRVGSLVKPADLQRLMAESKLSKAELLAQGIIEERWPQAESSGRRRVRGYRLNQSATTDDFLAGCRRPPERFEGVRSTTELVSLGWTPHYIRIAVRREVLTPVFADESSAVLDFIAARDDVTSLRLTTEQAAVVARVSAALGKQFKTFLLHGVTGSGKTLVYCHLIKAVLAAGCSALVLVPEITLAGTTLAWLRGFFGESVTVWHSALTPAERLRSWQGIRDGTYTVVVGPRSAVFAPLVKPGLIIVDEEHDLAYKQSEPAPRFHGRDSAIMRAKIAGIPILLGTASPSIESYHHATEGRYELLRLSERPGRATLPKVRVVDMRTDRIRGDLPFLSFSLKKAVEKRLEADQQVILYLNRRGYSPQVKCAECGEVPVCPHCAIHLTFHKAGHYLSCHYCGHVETDYATCRHCGGHELIYPGVGTQKLEENLPRLFPDVAAVRFDSDTASGRKRAHTILKDFAAGKYNLLLGTQMVTKGLDLPRVTLVGVISADQGLDRPDFRASEQTFARLLQVAGRSGRAAEAGEVIIQTYYPDHPVIRCAATQDYVAFYNVEIASREEHGYPPFLRVVNVVISDTEEARLEQAAQRFRAGLEPRVKGLPRTEILGPAPCPLYRVRDRYRRHLFIKTKRVLALLTRLREWEAEQRGFGLPGPVRIVVDVDPHDMM